jgi:hypothetical protein
LYSASIASADAAISMDCCALGAIFILFIAFSTLSRSCVSLRSVSLAFSSIFAILFVASLAGCQAPVGCHAALSGGVVARGGIFAAALPLLGSDLRFLSSPCSLLALFGCHLRMDPWILSDRLGGISAILMFEMTLLATVLLAHPSVSNQG